MSRSVQEEVKQDRCIKFVIGVGLVGFVLCLFPLAFDLRANPKYVHVLVPHYITRVAVVAATLPLIWDYAYDLTLPQRLTYPRTILLIAILVPNVTILSISSPSLHVLPVRLSVCFAFAKSQLFNCGLVAFIAGEAASDRLLVVLAMIALWGCLCSIFYTVQVFVRDAVSESPVVLVSSLSTFLLFVMLVWYVREMKTLDERRKMFAMTYVIAFGTYIFLKYSCYIALVHLHMEGYMQDSLLIIEIVTATGISIITSRMAQHDATIAMVSAG